VVPTLRRRNDGDQVRRQTQSRMGRFAQRKRAADLGAARSGFEHVCDGRRGGHGPRPGTAATGQEQPLPRLGRSPSAVAAASVM